MFSFKSLKRVVTPKVTAEQVHAEFDQAADKAVQQAKFLLERLGIDSVKKEVDSLYKFGFTNSSLVTSYKEKAQMAERETRNLSIIEKYSLRYPDYKFILTDQVTEICKKYGLICGVVSRFKGSVPSKNLKEIAAFKALKEEIYYEENVYLGNRVKFDPRNTDFLNEAEVERINAQYNSHSVLDRSHSDRFDERLMRYGNYNAYNPRRRFEKVPLFICAPAAEMQLNPNEKVDESQFIVKDDPIVLHFVKDGFLIISKWGPEASDPSLVNEKMN